MTLRDYQTDIAAKAVEILREHGIVYLAMQVRVGKTITALHTADLMGAQRVLLVTREDTTRDYELFLATKTLWEAQNKDIRPRQLTYQLTHKR